MLEQFTPAYDLIYGLLISSFSRFDDTRISHYERLSASQTASSVAIFMTKIETGQAQQVMWLITPGIFRQTNGCESGRCVTLDKKYISHYNWCKLLQSRIRYKPMIGAVGKTANAITVWVCGQSASRQLTSPTPIGWLAAVQRWCRVRR